MNLTIKNLTIHCGAPSIATALLSSMFSADEPTASKAAQPANGRPAIGQAWPDQGGIYAGDFRSGDGSIYGLIVAPEQDIGRARWAPEGESDLSDCDGLDNTQHLRSDCPAAKLASEYQCGEHTDFYLPARRELLLAAANLHDTFGKESWYWTSTPSCEDYAWAVDFEYGRTKNFTRYSEFRVRPFRRFIY